MKMLTTPNRGTHNWIKSRGGSWLYDWNHKWFTMTGFNSSWVILTDDYLEKSSLIKKEMFGENEREIRLLDPETILFPNAEYFEAIKDLNNEDTEIAYLESIGFTKHTFCKQNGAWGTPLSFKGLGNIFVYCRKPTCPGVGQNNI